jgi:hypothetical protein
MSSLISIRLDNGVRTTLEAEATERGMGLATLIRELAADAARQVRRKRIRAQSAALARYVAEHPEARSFYEDWGGPRPTPLDMARLEPGQIVIVDWRDALPKKASKLRLAVVIQDSDLFDPDYPKANKCDSTPAKLPRKTSA